MESQITGPTNTPKYLYRFTEMRFSEFRLTLVRWKLPVIRMTEKGAWVDEFGREKFVKLHDVRKKYACLTEAEALESFHARKRRQIRILKAQLKQAEAALKLNSENDSEYWGF